MPAKTASVRPAAGFRPIHAKPGTTIALGSALVLLAATLLGIYQMLPPAPLAADAAANAFSATRAMAHVTAIAREPHPTGTPANDAVRGYIEQQLAGMGLTFETQQAAVVSDTYGVPYIAATVTNLVARLPGSDSLQAIMLVGHYDTVPMAPGAADDSHAVALLLEAARALKSGPQLKNDVIFLFTDGEELGMLGAKAFVRDNPLAKSVGLVLNFEGRGTGGPVIMYETSPDSGALIREFGKAAPYPLASSLATAIYRMMPNGSDFSAFLAADIPGFNFAFIDGAIRYHTARDDAATLDRGSLQMAGANTLAIVRHFGGLDLTQLTDPDAVYFNPIRFVLLRYPISLALPLAIALGLILTGLVAWSVRQGRVRLQGVALGFLALLSSFAIAALAVMVLGVRLQAPYFMGFAHLGYTGIGIFVATAAIITFRRWTRLAELVAGALAGWLVVLVLLSRLLPAASYLVAWPMIFGLAGFAWLIRTPDPERPSAGDWCVMALLAVPAILTVVPLFYLAFVALPQMFGAWITLGVVLLAFLVAPHIFWIVTAQSSSDSARAVAARRFVLPVTALITVTAFVLGAVVGPTYSHPRRDTIYYGLNANTGRAVFGSPDPTADTYTSQFLGASPRTGSALTDIFRPEDRQQSDAPVLALPAPQVSVISDSVDQSVRTVRLQIRSQRQAPALDLVIGEQSGVTAVRINDRLVRADRRGNWPWQTIYFGTPNEGFTLEVQMPVGRELVIRVTDITVGLPALPGMTITPRSEVLVPGWPGDTTQVAATFRF